LVFALLPFDCDLPPLRPDDFLPALLRDEDVARLPADRLEDFVPELPLLVRADLALVRVLLFVPDLRDRDPPPLFPAALAARAPTTPPTTAPTGPAILPTTAPAAAPAASLRMGGN